MNDNGHCVSQKSEAHLLWAHAFIGIFIDAALFGTPIWVIYKNMRFGSQAIKVILVFCVGLVAIVVGIIRLGFMMTTDFGVDTLVTCLVLFAATDIFPAGLTRWAELRFGYRLNCTLDSGAAASLLFSL
jgi:hypothetical protein